MSRVQLEIAGPRIPEDENTGMEDRVETASVGPERYVYHHVLSQSARHK